MAVAKIGDVYYNTLTDAITDANNLDSAVIELVDNINLESQLTVTGHITINGAYTITRGQTDGTWYRGGFFSIAQNASLTIGGGVIVDGGHQWIFKEIEYNEALQEGYIHGTTQPTSSRPTLYSGFAFVTKITGAPTATARLFTVNGMLIVNQATIQNHLSDSALGVVLIGSAGTMILNDGALITHNATPNAGTVVYMNDGSTFIVNAGSEISDNYFAINGGCIVNKGGTMTMNGGEIKNNRGVNCNGTVIMLHQGNATFIMHDGLICSNMSLVGSGAGNCPAVYVHSTGVFEMYGGAICHNIGWRFGGVSAPNTNTTINIYGGSIIDNIQCDNQSYPGYTSVFKPGGGVITGGTFTQDVTEYCADGFSTQLQPDGTYGCVPYEYAVYTCVDGVGRSGGFYVCVDGVIKKIDAIYQSIDGVIKES
jgi:hypothetical protein